MLFIIKSVFFFFLTLYLWFTLLTNNGTTTHTIYKSITTTKVHYITVKRFYTIQLLTHYLHYLQFKAITGAAYNNTIYITYSTKQYDYLFNDIRN